MFQPKRFKFPAWLAIVIIIAVIVLVSEGAVWVASHWNEVEAVKFALIN